MAPPLTWDEILLFGWGEKKAAHQHPEHRDTRLGRAPVTGTGTALTRAAKLLALDLADALVGQAPGAGTAGTAGLDGVGAEEVCQPLQVAVADEGVLGQMPAPGTAGDPPPGTAGDRQLQPWLPAELLPHQAPSLPGIGAGVGTHRVWMARREVKVPLARLWILLS